MKGDSILGVLSSLRCAARRTARGQSQREPDERTLRCVFHSLVCANTAERGACVRFARGGTARTRALRSHGRANAKHGQEFASLLQLPTIACPETGSTPTDRQSESAPALNAQRQSSPRTLQAEVVALRRGVFVGALARYVRDDRRRQRVRHRRIVHTRAGGEHAPQMVRRPPLPHGQTQGAGGDLPAWVVVGRLVEVDLRRHDEAQPHQEGLEEVLCARRAVSRQRCEQEGGGWRRGRCNSAAHRGQIRATAECTRRRRAASCSGWRPRRRAA